ncbi:hypothetical protein TRFO_07406 [Tritrichomonas foetus]|uniref:Uncharacterized protein n=1 Tax=Tritrichomonas foetus TaxID=1144522 RepID=A0A1J4JSW4_9EUKA|nr:hypothetical protein TRFO_07405 [Tritrichomonas foetus]OHT01835.1 hypothetical protein TRFO_07406 [Tritrichomonas foetus]|eukprot:OHT01834.1 hypothetical protein TRFO_07405 [Tritrichomonas foetus]
MTLRGLIRDDDSPSSDEFEQLRSNLPTYSPPSNSARSSLNENSDDNDFAQWQLNRFNRTGNINICSLFGSAFKTTFCHLFPLMVIYSLSCIVLFVSFYFRLFYIFIPCEALFSLISTSISFSLIGLESPFSRLHFLLSKQSIVAFLIQCLRSSTLYFTLCGMFNRASSTTGRFIILLVVRYITEFHSCFVFEGRLLNISSTFSFAFRLAFFVIPPAQANSLYLLNTMLLAIGPFSLGVTCWIAYNLRSYVFLAVCGSGTSTVATGNAM